MIIKKRSGELQEFDPSKILSRLRKQSIGLQVQFDRIAIEVQQLLYSGISTKEIDFNAAKIAASYITTHPDYSILASRLMSTRLEKELNQPYIERCGKYLHPSIIKKIDEWKVTAGLIPSLDYFGINSMMSIYAIRNDSQPIELPSEVYFRVALFLSNTKEDFENLYQQLIDKKISLASPILINAGRTTGGLISCSLNTLKEDSREGIIATLDDISAGSKNAAGIGLWIGNLRSSRTLYGGRAKAGGVIKFAKILNGWMNFFQQSENKRGAAALYTDIWHLDLFDFINLRSKNGSDDTTAKDLFTAISVPDLFWKRLEKDETWSLFCPHQVKEKFKFNLYDYHGEEFENKYLKVEQSDIFRLTYSTKDVMLKISKAQVERGTPYIFNRDTANKNYNLSHLGVLKGLNLCIEFTGYHDSEQSAQCDLGAIPLHNHTKDKEVDWDSLKHSVQLLTKVLNTVIDKNEWSYPSARIGGINQRNIGIGIVGLADLALELDLPFTSAEMKKVNRNIQEYIYFHAIKASNELAKKSKNIPKTILDSPLIQKGQLCFNWDIKTFISKSLWRELVEDVKQYGVMNSLFCCNMPTASTSTLLGCTESFEPLSNLVLSRNTISGEFIVINRYLVNDLLAIGMWNEDVLNQIIKDESVKNLNLPLSQEASKHFKDKYQTIWEISQKELIDMASDRQLFVDQSQSMNLYWNEGDLSKIVSSLVYGWKKGLKTGVYYTRVKPALSPDKNLAFKMLKDKPKTNIECINCSV